MKRVVSIALVALVAFAGVFVTSASAGGTDVCSLVSKKEAAAILGHKVVKVSTETNSVTDEEVCVYRTKFYVTPFFKKSKSPFVLEVTWGALTEDLRAEIDDNLSDLEPIADLGDEAYFDNADVIVIRGEEALQTGVSNWSGSTAKYAALAEAAARKALPRLPTG